MAGYVKTWNFDQIQNQLRSAVHVCTDPGQDGYSTWPIKQDLYQLQWMLDELIQKCPRYIDEPEWLREQEQSRIIDILKS